MSSKLKITDKIDIEYSADNELAQAIEEHKEYIKAETRCTSLRRVEKAGKLVDINGKPCRITIRKSTTEGALDDQRHCFL